MSSARLLATIGIVIATVAGCAGIGHIAPTARKTGDFVRHEHAVRTASIDGRFYRDPGGNAGGLQDLVPLGDCVLAVGTYYSINVVDEPRTGATGPAGSPITETTREESARVPANWTGEQDCTRLRLSPPEAHPRGGVWPGGGLNANAAVSTGGNVVIGAGDAGLSRRDPDGSVHQLAPAPGGTASLARTDGWLFGAGGGGVWTSDDDGATVRRLVLPDQVVPRGKGSFGVVTPTAIGADGDTVVVAGGGVEGFTPGLVWRSGDRGRTWNRSELAASSVASVIRAGDLWLILGGGPQPYGPRPYVASSTDGSRWTVQDTMSMGEGVIVDTTVDSAGYLVLLGQIPRRHPSTGQPSGSCGVVWTGWLGSLNRQELGCGDQPLTSVAILSDGRVMIAGNTDLWLRS